MSEPYIFEPFPWQVGPLNDKSETLLLTGGVGGGKSVLAGNKLDAFLRHYPGATCVASRKVFKDAETSIIPQMKLISNCENDPNVTHLSKPDRIIYKHRGKRNSTLWLVGMKGGNKEATGIRSFGEEGEVDVWWMEEGTEYDEDDFEEVLGRTRGHTAPWTQIILTTNPDVENHWIRLRLILGEEASVYFSGIDDNPTTTEAYRRRVASMRGVKGKRLRDMLWVSGEGMVVDTWLDKYSAISSHIGEGNVALDAEYIPGNGRVVWYVDDGYSGEYDKKAKLFTPKSQPRAFLFVQERSDGTIAVFGEHLEVQMLADRHIARALKYTRKMGWADPTMVVHDGSSPSLGGHLIRARLNAAPIRCKIEDGINELNSWIGPDKNNVRKTIVHPRCRFVRFEMTAYVYDKNGVPVDMNNHTIDALRYGVWNKAYGKYRPVSVSPLDGSGTITEDKLAELQRSFDLKYAEAYAKIELEMEKLYG